MSKLVTLTDQEYKTLSLVARSYHMRIPEYYFSLIQNFYDDYDPVKSQCIPSKYEINEIEGESVDPLAEEKTSPVPFLVHRYPDRVLLVVTSKCFMYCRHCTRKRLWREKAQEP